MSGVYFERFSAGWSSAIRQGLSISSLVQTEGAWLAEARPATVEQHGSARSSIRNIRRSARRNPRNYHEYVIRENNILGAPLGMAKIVGGQLVAHPDRQTFVEGTYLDYWLFQEAEGEEEIHTATALVLLTQCGRMALRKSQTVTPKFIPASIELNGVELVASIPLPVLEVAAAAFAVVPEGRANPPSGLIEKMQAVEGPAMLRAPAAEAPEQSEIEGSLSRLYHAEYDFSVPVISMPPGLLRG